MVQGRETQTDNTQPLFLSPSNKKGIKKEKKRKVK